MSFTRKSSVKKLVPSFLMRDPVVVGNEVEDNDSSSWKDTVGKCSSLPDLARTKSCDSGDHTDGDIDFDSGKERKSRKKPSILRNLRLKSLSKRRNFDIILTRTDTNPNSDSPNCPVNLVAHENKYDKYPGSGVSKSKGNNVENGDITVPKPQKSAPIIDASKHNFPERIGYLLKRSPHKSKGSKDNTVSSAPISNTVGGEACFVSDTIANGIAEGASLTNGAEANVPRENFKRSCESHDGSYTATGRDTVTHTNSIASVSSNTGDGSPRLSCPNDRPPARPPKPEKLRGEPIIRGTNLSPVTEDEQELLPPQPPSRHPSANRNFPTVRAIQLMYGNRESGAYECIDEPAPVQREFGLPGELRKLPHQPWYWGPLNQEEAEEKLRGLPDGYFLVRDSSDERYLLSLSFNSNGRPVHTRFEYVGGQFSINDSQGYLSVVDLIEDAVRESQNGVYSFMQNVTGTQTFPARLTNPVSRFTEMKTLQHLCRFVIRETFPRHYIADLPVPKKIRRYILENQYEE